MTSEKHFIPLSILNEIRCAQCIRFVTCGPVFVVPNDNVLCGRCCLWAKQEFRNYAFEALAQIFWFPCCNWEKKCSRKLEWNQSLEHEDNCAYDSCCSRFWRRGLCCAGRREIPIGDIRHTPVPPKLLDNIKCVHCEGYLNCEPVHILPDGSNVCHRCIRGNGIPPNSRRNLVYEQLSRILVFPCIFRIRGCPTRLKFGGDLWEHESNCPYNMSYKRQSDVVKKTSQKERGVITTHSGHYYGTITPNSVPFAPPTPNKEFDVNKQIVKSLKKHQERKLVTADQIQSQITEKYPEDGYSEDGSGGSTPSRYEEDIRQNVYNVRNQDRDSPDNRDSGYQTASRPKPENISQNLMPKVHEDRNSRSSYTRIHIPRPDYDRESSASFRKSQSNSPDINAFRGYYKSNSSDDFDNSRISYNGTRVPCTCSENKEVVGLSPNYSTKELDPLAHNPSFRALNRSESVKSNQELIKELKGKLKKNNSMRNDIESPYVKCKNLEDVLVTHDRIAN